MRAEVEVSSGVADERREVIGASTSGARPVKRGLAANTFYVANHTSYDADNW